MSDLFHYLYEAAAHGNYTTDYLWSLPLWAQPHILHIGHFLSEILH